MKSLDELLSGKTAPTAYIYFGIAGDFNPWEFANHISLPPDKCIAKHTKNRELEIPKSSLLRYAQVETFSKLVDVYELSEKLVALLEPYLNQLVSAIRMYAATATLQIVLSFPISEDISTPILGLSRRVVSFIASTEASVDIDTYRV